uniref:Ovule protein n=1 Tax=Loa loa TaxID=7209 RepID=A0A1I7V5T0_LOALO
MPTIIDRSSLKQCQVRLTFRSFSTTCYQSAIGYVKSRRQEILLMAKVTIEMMRLKVVIEPMIAISNDNDKIEHDKDDDINQIIDGDDSDDK